MRIVVDLQGAQTASRTRGIGRYSMAFATALVANRGAHEVVLALNGLFPETIQPIRDAFRNLLPRENIRVWEAPGPLAAMGGNDVRRRRAALVYDAFLASLAPDIVHVSSLFEGLTDDAVTGTGGSSVPTAVQLYDLIPLHDPATFLAPSPPTEAWYRLKLGALARADLVLAISEFTARDALDRLSLDPSSVVNVSAGRAAMFRPLAPDDPGVADLRRRLRLDGPFILASGTIDPHKNLDRLFRAVAQVPRDSRGNRPVVLPGRFVGRQKEILARMASDAGLPRDAFRLAGYLSDEDLVRLYNACDLMVLPSLDEGFGLPALEAMACGAPTIGSDAASVPEIIGRRDALFDPRDVAAMGRLIVRGLSDEDFRRSLVASGLERAGSFSWDETGRRAVAAMEAVVGTRRRASPATPAPAPRAGAGRRRTLALVVAGGDDPDAAAALAAHYDVVVVAAGELPPRMTAAARRIETPAWLRANAHAVDRVAYLLGATPAHDVMIPLMEAVPGTAIVDEPGLGPALARLEAADPGRYRWTRALYETHGYGAVRTRFREPDAVEGLPASLDILQQARGVALPSDAALDAARDRLGPVVTRDWRAVPPTADDAGRRRAEAIEAGWETGLPGLAASLAAIEPAPGEAEAVGLAWALARSFPRPRPERQLLLDVSHTAQTDMRTGIQRVVRALVLALIEAPPAGFRVEPVYLDSSTGRWRYCYARRFTLGLLGCPPDALADDVAEPAAGDALFVLDLSGEYLVQARAAGLLADLRQLGLAVYATIYDILPVLLPHRFPAGTQSGFEAWLRATAATDGVLCISAAVAGEYRRWLAENVAEAGEDFRIGWFHLGADIDSSAPTRGLPADAGRVIDALASRPTFLMVGTIEPRKGHLQAIRAFERLWAAGTDVNLAIVGAEGWTVLPEHLRSTIPEIVAALRDHPERGRRLFWLDGISDEYLERVYAAATCLLAPSEGEGFGLPLIEAARHGVPILARDLPVFREVAGDRAAYFAGTRDTDLAAAVEAWLALHRRGAHPVASGMPWSTWRDSAAQLARFVEEDTGAAPGAPAGSRRPG